MSSPEATPGASPRALAAVGVAAALTPLNSTMIAVALPAMARDFGAAPSSVTVWVVTVYLIATIVLQMPAGAVADRIGYKPTLALGRWLFMGGAAAATFAPSIWFVIIGRLFMAAGGALMLPTAMALLRVIVPEARRPRAFGAMGAVMGGAAALGPALGGLIIARASWRVLFLVNLPLTVLSWWLQPSGFAADVRARVREHPFDWGGSALLGGSLVLVVLATRIAAPLAYAAVLGGLLLFAALIVQARSAPAPVLDFTLFREAPFVAGSAVIALQNLAMYALLVQVPFLFAGGSMSGSRFSVVVMAMTAMMAVTSPVGGRLAERIGSRITVLAGGVAGAVGVASLVPLSSMARAGAPISALHVAVPLVVVGLGLGLSTGPSQAAALSAIDPHRSGMASAAIATLRYIGAIVGTAILGLALSGDSSSLAGQQAALWCFAAAFVLSAVAALKFRAPR
ncbi:MAG: MFS transporter [Vicinamibacterales bacterium]